MDFYRLSDTELILLILAALYLFECVLWLAPGKSIFGASFGRPRCRVAHSALSNDRGSFVLLGLAPWSKEFIVDATSIRDADAAFDVEAARERYQEIRRVTGSLGFLCTLQFSLVFILGPVLLYDPKVVIGGRTVWAYLLLCLCYWLFIIGLYWLAHRSLYREKMGERWKKTLMMLCSPGTAMRAATNVGMNAFDGFHPLTVACAICDPREFQKQAAEAIRFAYFPAEAEEADCPATFRDLLEAVARLGGVDPADVLKQPMADPDALAWCRRCNGQSTTHDETCPNCGSRHMVEFETPDDTPVGDLAKA
ncbi:hypothetical protein [Stratiformator vulcanicus]|uniref:Uncharacterized protein n=1 Tax=Stratiformator vulcanicus TaxID=2527980 RepID=A0A517QZR1_9PLAN|nr:hypothetical protein [Stratiformator vulcanicus]QDT37040.1 hypothetical protein Pan189_14060 [Stratiformator vulcanicus]